LCLTSWGMSRGKLFVKMINLRRVKSICYIMMKYHKQTMSEFVQMTFFWGGGALNNPIWALTLLLLRFLDHTHTHTPGRTHLNKQSACRGCYLQKKKRTHKRRISVSSLGFKPTLPAIEWPQTYTLDCTATAIVLCSCCIS